MISLQRPEQRIDERTQQSAGELALLLHSIRRRTDRLVWVAFAKGYDHPGQLVERDEQVEEALAHVQSSNGRFIQATRL